MAVKCSRWPARLVLACGMALSPRAAAELPPDRLEPVAFPVLAASSDLGVSFGVLGFLSKFEEGYWPYRYRIELQLVASVKEEDDGLEVTQQDHVARIDLPGLAGGGLRLLAEVGFSELGNVRYHGVGNQSPPALKTDIARKFQYARAAPLARLSTRIDLIDRRLQLLASIRASHENIGIYEGSRLASDAPLRDADGDPFLRATRDHLAAVGTVGLLLDTRDHEAVPSRGLFHELSFRMGGGGGAFSSGATLNARFFCSLIDDRLVLATRLLTDILFGAPPFYELSRAGGFTQLEAMGGREGVRGVPFGRYRGDQKIIGDVELRAMFLPFGLLGQRFRLGAAGFVDAGRVWSTPELDGPGLSIKYGIGAGLRLQWGEAVVFRADFAYAPSEAAPNVPPPIGFYIQPSQSF